MVRTVHPLDRHAERFGLHRSVDLDCLQMVDQGWALEPGRVPALLGDVVASECGDGDGHDVVETDLGGE